MSSNKSAPKVATTATGWQKIPSSYKELVKAFRALVKELEAAKRIAASNWESIGEWKGKAETAWHLGKADRERAVFEIEEREKAEANLAAARKSEEDALALLRATEESSRKRETELHDAVLQMAESERELRSQIRYLETRITWAENGKHAADLRLHDYMVRNHATPEEIRGQFPSVRIDHRGTVA